MIIRRDQEEFGNRWQVTKPFIPEENPSILLQSNTIGKSLRGNKVETKEGHLCFFYETTIVD
jgi:hypothetical protein